LERQGVQLVLGYHQSVNSVVKRKQNKRPDHSQQKHDRRAVLFWV